MRLLWFINEGYKRPSELQRKIPDASRKVLNVQLKELEEHELVSKVI
ncbi:winged helix-turn-helix transcriptional regulator [Sphingobacterium sp.]